MFEGFMKHVCSLLGIGDDIDEDETEASEEEILQIINNEELDENPDLGNEKFSHEPFGKSEVIEYDVEVINCKHRTGKVTYICDNYGMIDNIFYFEPNQVCASLNLKLNDEVAFTTFSAKKNETERVNKIYSFANDSWELNDASVSESAESKELLALKRIINGRVIERKGRKLYIESAGYWCDLDKIEASYVPILGDWVSLEAMVSINENVIDLSGDILEVKSLKPLLEKTGFGRISFWSCYKEEGAIENTIYFTQMFCENGYVPTLGDEVLYDAIESDQGIYRWRALKVLPNKTASIKVNSSSGIQNNPFFDKNGILIKPSTCSIEVELDKTKSFILEVINCGNEAKVLTKTKFNSTMKTSQLILKSPKLMDTFIVKPNDNVKYVFDCKARFLGLSKEIFVFCFKNFVIAKTIEINVIGSEEMNLILDCKIDDQKLRAVRKPKYIKSNVNSETVLVGPKPWQPPKFVSEERRGVYKVPSKLFDALIEDSEFPKSKTEMIKGLEEYAPYFKKDLSISNYVDRFHTLLYVEEIEIKRNFRKYDMDGVFLRPNGDYFVVEVPGLAEQRPSLLQGDKIILSQPWSEVADVQQVGYIHEIHQNEVFVKFHPHFHANYDESECNIVFEPNLSGLSKCHDAVNRSMKRLGPKWLFPTSVNEKLPQINFEVPEEAETEAENVSDFIKKFSKSKSPTVAESPVSKNTITVNNLEKGRISKTKKLRWFNKTLNERQKLAVVSVLKGQGRPLPYIIFGPPGTGKTITLVEIIMQIYHLIPESRLLVTTPSNSSADLVCERLIELGNFKPGQLVRLVAFSRASEGMIPAKLIPYSSLVDLRDDDRKTFEPGLSPSFSRLKGRHRITVGTCVCVGSIHYMGFPEGHFTHILIDEAGQATEPELLISATFQNIKSGQVIMTGDPQQLGPVCISNIAKSFGLGTSLLQRFVSTFPYARDFDGFPETSGFDPRFITRLNVNYRSLPEILSLPSQLFYDSELIPAVSGVEGVEVDIVKKFNFEIENRKQPPAIIFHGILGQNYQESDSPSWHNPHEIWQAVTYLKKCYSVGLKSSDVGIISPYMKQVQKLRYLLTVLGLAVPKIGTVEDFQGQERYVIIVSTVRSCFNDLGTDIRHYLGFVASPRRLNVALTRARALIIILGNPLLLSNDPYWKNVVEYCVKNNSYTGCNLDQLTNFEESVDQDL